MLAFTLAALAIAANTLSQVNDDDMTGHLRNVAVGTCDMLTQEMQAAIANTHF